MSRRALHLLSFLLLIGALLYGATGVRASEAPETRQAQPDSKTPHIALLLPTGSEAFGRAAEAVRAGFLEASKKPAGRTLPVRLYAVTDHPQNVIASYRQALAGGAQLVVGPLTRNGVS